MQTIKIPSTDISVALLNDACRWRVETFWTKEPATVGWLGMFTAADVLWDVGANIGLYSLFAASHGRQVIAIEPMIENLYALATNLKLNPALAKLITIVPAALSNQNGFTTLHLSNSDIASSCHAAGEPLNYKLEPKRHWQATQGCVLLRADDLSEQIGMPTAVKIDVDGFEHKVVAGFGLLPSGILTWCIEVNWNLQEHRHMVEALAYAGYDHNPKQYAAAQRKDGPFVNVGEMLLTRR
jgi:FkbM family methyltransferase